MACTGYITSAQSSVHLCRLARHILHEKFEGFVDDHIARCRANKVSLGDFIPGLSDVMVNRLYREVCKKFLEVLAGDETRAFIERAVTGSVDMSFNGDDGFTIDDLIRINLVRGQSLKHWISSYTPDLNVILHLSGEIDMFVADCDRAALQSYASAMQASLVPLQPAYLENGVSSGTVETGSPRQPMAGNEVSVARYGGGIVSSGSAASFATKLSDVIERLRTYLSREEPHQKTVCDLRAIIRDVVDSLEQYMRGRRVVLICGRPPLIEAIPFGIYQLFHNLILTLLNGSERGSDPIVIHVSPDGSAGGRARSPVVITLRGRTAPGLKELCVGQVNSLEEGEAGWSLCRRIVAAQGGSIDVAYQEGHSATVTLHLPS